MTSRTQLSVNLNAVAMLRNRRDLPWPSVVGLGRIALDAGAAGLTVHPRPDQRHIRATDLAPLKALLTEEYPEAEFNIEGYPTPDFLKQVFEHQPHQVTLVPDHPSQATSDHGWDFIGHQTFLTETIARLHNEGGFRVALFCDPDATEGAIEACAKVDADRVELYTGPYGATHSSQTERAQRLSDLEQTAKWAATVGLECNAGHDLTVENVPELAARVPNLKEVSIGHGLTADALVHGMAGAVHRFNQALAIGCDSGNSRTNAVG